VAQTVVFANAAQTIVLANVAQTVMFAGEKTPARSRRF
jgi:hypothetical protein